MVIMTELNLLVCRSQIKAAGERCSELIRCRTSAAFHTQVLLGILFFLQWGGKRKKAECQSVCLFTGAQVVDFFFFLPRPETVKRAVQRGRQSLSTKHVKWSWRALTTCPVEA